MTRNFYITTLLFLSCCKLHAQADCKILFRYIGSITSDSIKITKIGLPTTPFLIDYIHKNSQRAFSIYKLKDSIINDTLISHLSSDFCMESENIIDYVFKHPKRGYLLRIFENQIGDPIKHKMQEILMPLDSIKFTSEFIGNRRCIIIDLGNIKI
jgi:hypothetical protein